ncbi:hypothetical protein [Azospirillum sp. B510]|uniref:hypothetical protein n=1 Tax=Azospirillum sp. (strain B510) TaxID=137722 RepID=UPI0013053A1E|nr:hypothetical protein [Azospirillum sp. B510]
MLVRGTWMETLERFNLFQQHPPALIAQFAERLPMVAGYVAQEASTATSYAWVVFIRGFSDTRWRHIPPCRRALEQPGDYPAWEDQARLMSDMQLLRLLDRYETDGARPPMPEATIRAALAARAQQAEEVPA